MQSARSHARQWLTTWRLAVASMWWMNRETVCAAQVMARHAGLPRRGGWSARGSLVGRRRCRAGAAVVVVGDVLALATLA